LWGETADERGRRLLVVSRDAVNAVMQRVLVAPVTRRIRGVPSELLLGRALGHAIWPVTDDRARATV
jgi:mRNA-degrading endonuclease toxin of MazEF toxin-antitoxin module